MPYLLMSRCYDYDDEHHTEQNGGYPELVFRDDQHDEALAELERRREEEWPSCTPLSDYYQETSLSSLSSSGLDDAALAGGISALLGRPLSPGELLDFDFTVFVLTDEQQHLIGLMLDLVSMSYLDFVQAWGGL